jgi:hypothetical protein
VVQRTVLGSMLGLALTLAQPALCQVAFTSSLCSGPQRTEVFSREVFGAGTAEAFRKRLWFPGSQPWPQLSPRKAIRLAYRELLRSGITGDRTVYIGRLDLPSTGYHDGRLYLVSFAFICGDQQSAGWAEVLVLMNGTVILPGNVVVDPDPSPPGGAPLQRFTAPLATFVDLYESVWARARRLVRDVRCSVSNCPEQQGSVDYHTCKEEHEVQIDPATVSAEELWWSAEEEWPRLSPGEAMHLASAKLKSTSIDLGKDHVWIDVSWRSAKGGWYYLIGFTAWVKSCSPAYVNLAVLMDGSVLVPWPEAKPNPHLRPRPRPLITPTLFSHRPPPDREKREQSRNAPVVPLSRCGGLGGGGRGGRG